jgi:hypothetical protein
MPTFWQRLFGSRKQESASLTLVEFAENYLTVFEIASGEEKTQHATKLFDAANETAQHSGAKDFLSLIETSDVVAIGEAAVYSRYRFDEITSTTKSDYWLSAYALTHLMILNHVRSLEDAPRAKLTAANAAHLYSAEYAQRQRS